MFLQSPSGETNGSQLQDIALEKTLQWLQAARPSSRERVLPRLCRDPQHHIPLYIQFCPADMGYSHLSGLHPFSVPLLDTRPAPEHLVPHHLDQQKAFTPSEWSWRTPEGNSCTLSGNSACSCCSGVGSPQFSDALFQK